MRPRPSDPSRRCHISPEVRQSRASRRKHRLRGDRPVVVSGRGIRRQEEAGKPNVQLTRHFRDRAALRSMRENRIDDDGMALDKNLRCALDKGFVDLLGTPPAGRRSPAARSVCLIWKCCFRNTSVRNTTAPGWGGTSRGERARQHRLPRFRTGRRRPRATARRGGSSLRKLEIGPRRPHDAGACARFRLIRASITWARIADRSDRNKGRAARASRLSTRCDRRDTC